MGNRAKKKVIQQARVQCQGRPLPGRGKKLPMDITPPEGIRKQTIEIVECPGASLEAGANQISDERPWYEKEDSQHALNRRLFSAIEDCSLEKVRDCIAKGADVNARISINEGVLPIKPGIMQDLTPLMCAAMLPRLYGEEGPLEIARLLIDKGANLDARSGAGDTALDFAKSMCGFGIARMLIERGVKG